MQRPAQSDAQTSLLHSTLTDQALCRTSLSHAKAKTTAAEQLLKRINGGSAGELSRAKVWHRMMRMLQLQAVAGHRKGARLRLRRS
eukprot:1816646-Amphidinium_carterae.1